MYNLNIFFNDHHDIFLLYLLQKSNNIMYFFNVCQMKYLRLKNELSSQFFYRKVLGRRFKLDAQFLLLVKHPNLINFNHRMLLNLTDF